MKFRTGVAMLGALALFAAGCGDDSDSGSGSGGGGGDTIKVGFAQTGSESGWRSANTESMKEAFSKENGFDLVFNAADNDPAAQISAVRSFISQGVDAIVIAPIVEDGWDDPGVQRPPLLGEHTDSVLAGRLGLSPERIAQLREGKAI